MQGNFPYISLSSGYDAKREAHVHSRQGSIADQEMIKIWGACSVVWKDFGRLSKHRPDKERWAGLDKLLL